MRLSFIIMRLIQPVIQIFEGNTAINDYWKEVEEDLRLSTIRVALYEPDPKLLDHPHTILNAFNVPGHAITRKRPHSSDEEDKAMPDNLSHVNQELAGIKRGLYYVSGRLEHLGAEADEIEDKQDSEDGEYHPNKALRTGAEAKAMAKAKRGGHHGRGMMPTRAAKPTRRGMVPSRGTHPMARGNIPEPRPMSLVEQSIRAYRDVEEGKAKTNMPENTTEAALGAQAEVKEEKAMDMVD